MVGIVGMIYLDAEINVSTHDLIIFPSYLFNLRENRSVGVDLIVDTGCTSLAISEQYMRDMGYKPIGVNITSAADGEFESNTYVLKNFWVFGYEFGDIYVSSCKLKNLDYGVEPNKTPRFHGLVGMLYLECFNWSYDSELNLFTVNSINQRKYKNFKSLPPTDMQLSNLITKNLIANNKSKSDKEFTRSTIFQRQLRL